MVRLGAHLVNARTAGYLADRARWEPLDRLAIANTLP